MACVSAIRLEKDVYSAELLMKKPVTTVNFDPHDQKYRKILTEFAFEKYFEESMNSGQVQFIDIDARVGSVRSTNNRMYLVTNNVCDCSFYATTRLPCKHILAFRRENEVDLFDASICNHRWLKENMDFDTQLDYVLDDQPNVEIIQTPSQPQQTKQKNTYNQKFRKVKQQCKQICSLLAELPSREFEEQFGLLKEFAKNVNGLVDGI